MDKDNANRTISRRCHPGSLGNDDRAADKRHEPIRHGMALHHGNVDGTYAGIGNPQDRNIAAALPLDGIPIITQPQVVRTHSITSIAKRNNELRANHHPSTNRAVVYPHDDDEAALLDAIDAGDCDASGNPIPWPRYRGA